MCLPTCHVPPLGGGPRWDCLLPVQVLLPMPICLFDPHVSPGGATLAIALPGLAHVIVGNILEPKLFGSQFRMSPVVILFSLGVWWILWGIVGSRRDRPPHPLPPAPRPSGCCLLPGPGDESRHPSPGEWEPTTY